MEKTIFITVAETSVLRNLLRTDFWDELIGAGVRIVLVTTPAVEPVVREFAQGKVIVAVLPALPVFLKEKIIAFLARNGFMSSTQVIMQRRTKAAGESRVPLWLKHLLMRSIGSVPMLRALVRRADLSIEASGDVAALFARYAPSLVFGTVLTDAALDVPLLREAKRRKIQTVGMVRGWDNLTTYGLLRILPDIFFAQNDFLAEKVVSLHGMPKDKVVIVGTPFFDLYRRADLLVPREVYCTQVGIDPSDRIVLYGAIGDYLFPHEGELADVFESLVTSGALSQNTQVIFRAHPAFSSPLEYMHGLAHVQPDRNATYTDSVLQHWDMTTANTVHLINSIYHADVVVTAGSTLMIEAALLDKSIVSVAFDGRSKVPYWFSIARFHDRAVHIVDLLKTGGVRVAHSEHELAEWIRGYLDTPGLDAEGRVRLVARFAGPNIGEAGRRMGELVVHLASQGLR